MEHIPQDYLEGNLSNKTISELKELLERQEKLLKKIKFLRTLPDGGKKVHAFAEKLQEIISERQKSVTSPELSKSHEIDKVVSSPETSEKKINSDTEISSEKGTKKPVSRFKKKNITHTETNTNNSPFNQNFSSFIEQESKFVTQTASGSIRHHEQSDSYSVKKDQVSLDELGETLNKMDIDSECDYHAKYPAGEYMLNVIERTHNNRKRNPLKLNKDLKISKLEDLPSEFRYHGKKELGEQSDDKETKKTHRKITSLWEESALCPPSYKFPVAKEMALQESMRLQEEQMRKQEEMQAIYAAEKLAEKLNIKMEKFNPEGKDMSYREPETLDSDDDLEGVD